MTSCVFSRRFGGTVSEMLKLALVLCVCTLALVNGQCPVDTINKYLQCEGQAMQQKMEAEKKAFEEMKAKIMQDKQKFEACFTNFGCTVPKPPGSGAANSSEENEEQKNQTHVCREAVHQQMQQNIQTCVKDATGLSFPAPSDHDRPNKPHPKPFRGPFGKNGPVPSKLLLKFCPPNSTDAQQQVLQCLNDSMQDLQLQRPNVTQFLEEFCSAKNNCLTNFLSGGCNETDLKNAFKDAAKAMANCSKAEFGNAPSVAASLSQCEGVNFTQPHRPQGPFGGKGGPKGPFGGKGGPKGPFGGNGGPKGPFGGIGGPQGPFGGIGGPNGPAFGGMFDPCNALKGPPPAKEGRPQGGRPPRPKKG